MNDAKVGVTTLRLERLIPSPPRFFRALDRPAQLLIRARCSRPRRQARRPLAHHLAPPDGGMMATSGAYRIVEPLRRLVFTWA
jgi:uncharacterized protein YndB with AHSA1/START domain